MAIAIYHLMIFLGRYKIKDERYNLFFVVFSLSITLLIYVKSIILNDHILNLAGRKFAVSLLNFGILYGLLNCLSSIFKIKKRKYFLFFYFLLIPNAVFRFITYYNTEDFFSENTFLNYIFYNFPIISFYVNILVWSSFTLGIMIFIYFIIKEKLYKNINIITIYSGFFLTILYLQFQRTLEFLMPYGVLYPNNQYLQSNHFFIGIVAYLFVYGHARKFNEEHNDLIELKNDLENKVERRTKELKVAKEEIEVISKQKLLFFINLTHEMKTPLTLINNYLGRYIQRKGSDNDLLIIKQNIEKLTRDMVNFLDSEKIERGEFVYNNDHILDLAEFAKNKVELFIHSAVKKNIELTSEIDEDIFIKADMNAMDRIIDNLLMNAIKFTNENGKIIIILKKKEGKIIFSVADSGIGISEKGIGNIFKPFSQVSEKKYSSGGMGVGLSIVKNIVELLNGRITVESELNKGSKFEITLNSYEPKKGEVIEEITIDNSKFEEVKLEPKDVIGHPENYNILLVEDNVELLCYLQNELSDNYNVYIAVNGKFALDKIKSGIKPDLIISDIMMAEMDGYEFLENLFSNKHFESIPFIFLTAKTTSDEKVKGLSKGAIDYIYKPFSIEELKLKIDSLLTQIKKQRNINMAEAINAITDIIDFHGSKKNGNDPEKIFNEKSKNFKLTAREKEIILLIYKGLEHKEIGNKLEISTSTVIRHVQNIYEKINVHNKIELINLLFKE